MKVADNKALPDKETKPETPETDSKNEAPTSTGEYTERKQAVMGILKSHYGEEEVGEDNYMNMIEGYMADEVSGMKDRLGKYDASNKNILAMMEAEPELSGVLGDIAMGGKFTEVLPKYVDLEALVDYKGGDETKWEENNKMRMSNFDKMQSHKKMVEDNEAKSIETVEQFMANKKMEGENAESFCKYIAEIIDLADSGNLTEEFLERMFYAMNYKSDVEAAKQMGEVSAKNAKINATMKTEEDLKRGDGLPRIASKDEKVELPPASNDFEDRMDKYLTTRKSVI